MGSFWYGQEYACEFLSTVDALLDPALVDQAFDPAGLPSGFTNKKVHEFTAGANYYSHAHNAKMTVDVSYLPNGTPFADTGERNFFRIGAGIDYPEKFAAGNDVESGAGLGQ